jgi:PPOX class probable F420-dependent enzyme
MMPLFDRSTEFGQRVERRLNDEQVAWLITVDPDGTPQPSPVWFLHQAEGVLIYSIPGKPKVRNIESNPRVTLAFNTDPNGGDVVVLTGEARVEETRPAAIDYPEYLAKYSQSIHRIGMTPESFSGTYSTPIHVRLTQVRGF